MIDLYKLIIVSAALSIVFIGLTGVLSVLGFTLGFLLSLIFATISAISMIIMIVLDIIYN